MPKLKPLKFKELCDKLTKLGYKGPIAGGRHMHMYKGTKVIPIPNHGGKDISGGLIKCIINQIGISRDEWIDL